MCWLFVFKDTEPSPLQDFSSVRQKGGLPGPPPPVVPHPESIDSRRPTVDGTAHYCLVGSGTERESVVYWYLIQ